MIARKLMHCINALAFL